jgi:drug/metabolite transporter (DMT)-like permease
VNVARRGALFGLLAAVTFGVSAPFAKLLGARVPPLLLAALLYGGAGVALTLLGWRRRSSAETPLKRGDGVALLAITVFGGMVGPVLMLVGLARVSASAGALLLNLEGPLTALVAVAAFGEHLGRRALGALAFVSAGAVVLVIGHGDLAASGLGALAIAGACLAWALDNNLTQRLALKDPIALVRMKTVGAGIANLALAVAHRDPWPAAPWLGGALLLGAVSYGASVLLDAYALRLLGAAREAGLFATAPFVGAVAGALLFREAFGRSEIGAGLLMFGGVALLVGERHEHVHTHAPLEHEHLHVHDEHHRHEHGADAPSGEPHAHRHRHEPLTHVHPHTSDAHHRHDH